MIYLVIIIQNGILKRGGKELINFFLIRLNSKKRISGEKKLANSVNLKKIIGKKFNKFKVNQ